MKYLFIILMVMIGLAAFPQKNYEEEWGKIDSLLNLGQPATAKPIVAAIYTETLKENNAPQFLKASMYRMKLIADVDEEFQEKMIGEIEQNVGTSSFPIRNILHSMAAELYWKYYQSNRWKFLERTEPSGQPSADIRTWGLRTIVSKCIEHYTLSLSGSDSLKKIAVNQFDAILTAHPESRKFRPTLYDFLAHRAIDFYSFSESSLTQPASRFLVDNPVFYSDPQTFAAMNIITPDTFSFEYHATILLQGLLSTHLRDKDPSALVDADMKRLRFVHECCILPENDSLYLVSLRKLESRYLDHPSSTDVSYEIANQLVESSANYKPLVSGEHKWEPKEAHETASSAIKRFPDTQGAHNCLALIERIEQPLLDITTEFAVPPRQAALALVTYKNIGKLYLRILKGNAEDDRNLINDRQEDAVREYVNRQPIKSWAVDMPSDGDFQSHSAEISLPPLENGFYIMLASPDEKFDKSSPVAVNRFWRTGISYISTRSDEGEYDIFVLDREEGSPISEMNVQPFYENYNYRTRRLENKAGNVFKTDKAGFIHIPSDGKGNQSQYYLAFNKGTDHFITESYFYSYHYQAGEAKAVTSTYFFTDRAIYRPGQTICFKGIVIEKKGDDTRILPKYRTTVTFTDANGQKVSSLDVLTNDYGSFSGSFVAPQGSLTGVMAIQCETGSASFRVEEYKRPKFEVVFSPVEGSYKLGKTITVTGKASAYAGNAVTDGQVKYRVVRRARFPYIWWGWRDFIPFSPEMEISNGTSVTNNSGEFTVTFSAIPDYQVPKKFEPVFTYTVYADVTDLNGETHSGEMAVSAGYKALIIKMNLPGEVNIDQKVRFELKTTNLNGQKENTGGKIAIRKLAEPERILRGRRWNRPDVYTMTRSEFEKLYPFDIYENEGDISTWPGEKQVYSGNFDSKTDSVITPSGKFTPGHYLLEITTTDAFGEKVESKTYFTAFSSAMASVPGNDLSWFTLTAEKAEPGDNLMLIAGSCAKKIYAVYETQNQDDRHREMLDIKGSTKIKIPVTEKDRGNFTVNMAFVKYNRSFAFSRLVSVPYSNRKLDVAIGTFRDKLQPGQDEEWRITIKDPKGEKAAAELLAGMYDASLDAFVPHSWTLNILNYFGLYRQWDISAGFATRGSQLFWVPSLSVQVENREYDQLNWFGLSYEGGLMHYKIGKGRFAEQPMIMKDKKPSGGISGVQIDDSVQAVAVPEAITGEKGDLTSPEIPEQQPLAPKIRTDFNETAFFYPQLSTDENGDVVFKFKIPESLTRWKMMGLAYTKDLKFGQIEKSLVTQKDLMVFPNAPRFFREGDTLRFSAKIANISGTNISGTAELHFVDAITMKELDSNILLEPSQQAFTVGGNSNNFVSWNMTVPEGLQAVIYRVSASSGTFSDGEEAPVPVLSDRMMVTETLPLPVNGNQTRHFTFEKLAGSGTAGSTLRNYRLTLEFTSNPAWYAVQALPYLMEYPYECAEQVFSRYYANSIAAFIANSDPEIKRVFESWKNISPDALKSNLEKNQELKSILLEESPWVREAANESERKQRIAILFDLNRMSNELSLCLKKLREIQLPSGGWPWFKGMSDDRYITQHIVSGLGHLVNLGVADMLNTPETRQMIESAVRYLDDQATEKLDDVKKSDKDYLKNNHLGCDDIQYLYTRSCFMDAIPLLEKNTEAFTYFKNQALAYWNKQGIYMKGMLALALNRLKIENTPQLIMRSLSETALHSEETGMYWRNEPRGWFWYQAPIETQALMIEAFDKVMNDRKSVEELKVWLLKQKQTQDWKTTRATTEAVYALLLRGTNLLASEKLAEIKIGNIEVDPYKLEGSQRPEAGTGYFKTSWDGSQILPEMGSVTVTNPNNTVAWGAMYWQYFERLDKITAAGSPLNVSKQLFREINSATGPVLESITESKPLSVGDKVVVRVLLNADRDMEYIHLKDMRAAGFEPVNVLSGYHWQDGLGYYEATRDASSNFFISYLPKGTYVFEYRLHATQKGSFSSGITSVECMYAPEFAAHSEGIRVTVK